MAADYKKRVNNYVKAVMSGRRVSGRYEYLAVARYLRDLEATEKKRYPYYFDEAAALQACNFYKMLSHFKGSTAGSEFVLEPWQAFIVWNIFGWKKRSDGFRRFTAADLIVARKNGKTTLAAGVALYCMLLDGEPGAEIYAGAKDKEQAKIVWEAASTIAKNSPFLSPLLQFFKKAVTCEETASFFKPLSRDMKNKDGLNPHCAILDERHAWETDELVELIRTGMGARKQPLTFSISTFGMNKDVPYYEDVRIYKQILEGNMKQENQFVMIFALDDGDDWKDEKNWVKANPNLGVSCYLDYLRDEFTAASNKGGRYEVSFKTKNLNIWVDAPEVWIRDEMVAACNWQQDEKELEGQECYGGLDFASHVDLVALELYFPEQKCVKSFFWCPEEKALSNEDKVDYRLWAQQGFLKTTPGNVIDIDFLVRDILQICRKYYVKNLAFDPYKAYHGLIQGLIKGGLSEVLDEFSQSITNMSEPTKQLERMVHGREINFLNNPILRWMFSNVVIFADQNNNIKVHKGQSRNKIDGIAALINAIGGYMSNEAELQKSQIYTQHDLRTVNFVL